MTYILTTLFPIFGLIFLGFAGRRTQRLGATAASELNRFVVWFGLPSLLFLLTATTPFAEIWHPGFVLAFTLSTLFVFAATLIARRIKGMPLSSASLDALGASYANTGYIGIPLCLFVLGQDGMAPALVSSLVVVSVLFAIAVICVEVSLHAGHSLLKTAGKVSMAVLKNPLVVSPVAGLLWNAAGVELPQVVHSLLKLLGDATVPCALISLGAFLAHKQSGVVKGATSLVLIKLVLHPLLTWLLVRYVFDMPLLWANAAVLLAALPTGTGPYMLAEFYKHEASVVSRTILWSTAGSVLTLAALLMVL
ncbi:AEC family transporter [Thalassolituus sp. LLYu03]|uniref:AEC family transporter n=1 Tax=Thalassolituus sp. LLYu03 TaxID=3421656 RepID=UPI003D27B3F9